MNTLRTSWLRLPVMALAALGWLVISNHCALAACAESAKEPAMSCHSEQTPAKQDGECTLQCCKELRAPLLKLTQPSWSFDQSAFAFVSYSVALLESLAQRPAPVPLELDTGPPYGSSFAESVLQRSILAHAPPLLLS